LYCKRHLELGDARHHFSTEDTTNNDHSKRSNNEQELENRTSITRALADQTSYPPGKLTRDMIRAAEDALEFWVFERTPAGYHHALAILYRLVEEQAIHDYQLHSISKGTENMDKINPSYEVRPFLLNQVLDCWRTCWRDRTLDVTPTEMIGIVDDLETKGLYPDNRTFALLVEGMILRGDQFETPLIAQWLFDRRLELFDESDPETCPDTVFITTVIRAWAKSGRLEAPEIANELLEFMESLRERGWKQAGPDRKTYTSCMEAWQKSYRNEACEQMEEILEKMKDNHRVGADRIAYMYVLTAWANSKAPGSALKSMRLLREMVLLYTEGNDHIKPDHSNFSKVMFALIRSGYYDEVEELTEELEELYLRTGDPAFATNNECLKASVIAYAKCNLPHKAQDILDSLIEQAVLTQNRDLMPKRSYFVDVLVSWVRAEHHKDSAERAEDLLFRMVELSKSGFPELQPDSKCFEKVIQGWANQRNNPEIGKRSEHIFREMDRNYRATGVEKLKPTSKTVELVITAFSRSNESKASKRVRSLVREMERRYADGDIEMKPTRGAYTSLMLTLRRSHQRNSSKMVREIFDLMQERYKRGDSNLKPDILVYNILIDTLADRGDTIRVTEVLQEMLDDFASGNNEARPDQRIFNNVLRTFSNASKRGDFAYEAEDVLHRMESLGLEPDARTFHEMCFIWSQSEQPNAAARAEHYFHRIKEYGQIPSHSAHKALIDTWTSSQDPRSIGRSEAILNELLGAASNRRFRRPNYRAYRNLLHSIATSGIPCRSEQASTMLKTLPKGHVPSELLPPIQK
jgi:hypothetical protein